ncbi:MAG: DUF1572 family protein [Chitinophagaceae bacterium]|nr:DUF1572 family protein [Chitinophagaceae bacterium]
MLNNDLAFLYERDLKKLIDEINLFQNEENLWRTLGTVKNPAGNLALHITGGLNHFVGATLGKTGYIRNRDQEFSKKNVAKKELIAGLENVIPVVTKTLNSLTPEQMNSDFPVFFDKAGAGTGYVLIQLLSHLNYHLGQVNYLRRILE